MAQYIMFGRITYGCPHFHDTLLAGMRMFSSVGYSNPCETTFAGHSAIGTGLGTKYFPWLLFI